MKNIIHLYMALSLILALVSCGSQEKKTEKPEEHPQGETHAEVVLTKLQLQAINLQLGNIEQKNLTSFLRATGFLKVPPQNKANVTALVTGTVKSIIVQEGDHVEKGQVLATIASTEFVKIQQDYLDAIAQHDFAEAEFNRQKELSEKNISSQKTFQQANSNFNSARAKVTSLKQQLSLLGVNAANLNPENILPFASIYSPISGNISQIDVNIGSTIAPSGELMDIVDNSQLHLDLFIYEQDLAKVKTGQMVDVTLTNLPGKQYAARIFAIGSAFEGESKSVPVHAEITGTKTGLIEGMNVTANINTEKNFTSAVPNTAIVNYGGNDFIFIREQENDHAPDSIFTFQKIQVKKGATDGAFTEITALQSMEENPKVVVNGAFYLMSMLTNEGEHEH